MTNRIPIHALDPAGAADGQSPRYDAATGRVVWAPAATTTGGVSIAGEQLMQDGTSSPPVPLETEARDDYLYQG